MRWTEDQLNDYKAKIKPRINEHEKHDPDYGPESKLQAKAEKWAKNRGFHYFHDRSRGKNKRGILDLYIFMEHGRVVVFEFKSRRGRLRQEQNHEINKLSACGHEVYVVKSYKRFLEIVNETF